MHSSVSLINSPGGSSWHLPAALSSLAAYLLAHGHAVEQRYSHIMGLEHALVTQNPVEASWALDVIRDPSSTIQDWYKARFIFERVSREIATSDHFLVSRNNVSFVSSRFKGTIAGLIDAIEHRYENPWYGYMVDVELPAIKVLSSDIVAISIADERQVVSGFILAAMIKEAMPRAIVVLGGNFFGRMRHAFGLPGFEQLFRYCDAMVYGEGFEPLRIIAETRDVRVAPSTIWLDGDRVAVNQLLDKPVDFQGLPTPVFDLKVRQWSPDVVYPLYTMSHCPKCSTKDGPCSFCAINACSDSIGGPVRCMTPRRIAEHMASLGAHRFDIQDESFSYARQIALGRELKKLGYEATWQCYMNVEEHLADPGAAEALREAGTRAVQLGLESPSAKTLALSGKQGNRPELYLRSLDSLEKAGIQTHIFYICGLPGEPLTESLKWLPFNEECGGKVTSEKSGRYRFALYSRDELFGNPYLRPVSDYRQDYPFRVNGMFAYWDPNANGGLGGKDEMITHKRVDAMRDVLEADCHRHWGYGVTSTLPWWINRGRHSIGELKAMASQLPEEPFPLKDQVFAKISTIVRLELGIRKDFGSLEEIQEFARTLR